MNMIQFNSNDDVVSVPNQKIQEFVIPEQKDPLKVSLFDLAKSKAKIKNKKK
jgi:hypothetical protein